jgi:hypothetical protein
VNPDDDIVRCQCGYVYHYDCCEEKYCLDCQKYLKQEIIVPQDLRDKRDSDNEIIQLKKVKTSLNFGQRCVANKILKVSRK